jgi:hypothetical protein
MEKNILFVHLFGKLEKCRLLAKHGKYTIDVERLSDSKCFRVSGLNFGE